MSTSCPYNYMSFEYIKSKLIVLGLHLAIFMVLVHGYTKYISELYGYDGFVYEPNLLKYIVALVFVLVTSLITSIDISKPSTVYTQLALVVVLLPSLVLFSEANKPWSFTLLILFNYVLLVALVVFLRVTVLKLPSISYENLLYAILITTSLYIISVFLMGGGRYFNLNISLVYDYRTEAAENLLGIFGYISPLVGKVLLPFSLLLSLILRKYLYSVVSICSSIMVFGLTAHKGPLFYPVAILLIYAIAARAEVIQLILTAVLSVLIISIVDFWYFDNSQSLLSGWFGALTMRRLFFVPAKLNFDYFDFFSVNNYVFWSNSKLTLGLLKYPYSIDTSHLIGLEYYNREETGANTGWFGSGYMHAGGFGMFVYTVIIGIVFSFIDKISNTVEDQRLVVAGTVVPILTLITSSDLPTAFLTHGLFLNLLLISILKQKDRAYT